MNVNDPDYVQKLEEFEKRREKENNRDAYTFLLICLGIFIVAFNVIHGLINRPWNLELLPDMFFWILADILHMFTFLFPLSMGIICGIQIAKHFGKAWIGWLLGFLVLVLIRMPLEEILIKIPNVGPRLESLFNAPPSDYEY